MTDVKQHSSPAARGTGPTDRRADAADDDLDVEGHYLVTDSMRSDATSRRVKEAESWVHEQKHRRAAASHSRRIRIMRRAGSRRTKALVIIGPVVAVLALLAAATGSVA